MNLAYKWMRLEIQMATITRAGRIELFTARVLCRVSSILSSTRQDVRRTAQRQSPKWRLLCEKQFIDGRQTAKVNEQFRGFCMEHFNSIK